MDAQFWVVISMMIGYARVSTQDQNLDLQTEPLTRAGCEKIYEDKISGVRVERPGLTPALEMLREGWPGRTAKRAVTIARGHLRKN